MKTSKYQQVTVRVESSYGDTTAAMVGGVLVRTVGDVDVGVRRGIVDPGVVRTSADDAGVAPVQGLDSGDVKLTTMIPGATRTAGVITQDATDTYLSAVVGQRAAPSNDSVETGSTATVINLTAHSYSVGNLVMIGGQVRRIASTTTDSVTLDAPLSAAPSAGTTVYGVASYDAMVPPAGVGVALSAADPEVQYVCAGCLPQSVEVAQVQAGQIGQITATVQVGSYTRTTPTHGTSEACATGVVAGTGGGAVAIYDGTSVMSLRTSQVTAPIGASREWVQDVGATMGRGGYVSGPADAQVQIQAYQDGTLDDVDALVGTRLVAWVQVGSTPGQVWGVYYPEAYLVEAPKPTSIGIVQGVEFSLRASRGLLFRG